MNLIISGLVILLTLLTLFFSIRVFLNIVRYKEAALGMIFTNLDDSIFYFKIYAIAVSILAISRFMDIVNIFQIQSLFDLATALVLVTDLLLVIVFYRLSVIMNIKKEA